MKKSCLIFLGLFVVANAHGFDEGGSCFAAPKGNIFLKCDN